MDLRALATLIVNALDRNPEIPWTDGAAVAAVETLLLQALRAHPPAGDDVVAPVCEPAKLDGNALRIFGSERGRTIDGRCWIELTAPEVAALRAALAGEPTATGGEKK